MAMIGKRIALGTAAALGFVLASSPAAAQATRTWISGVGDDVNPCSRTAPCKTFAGAISKTATGGEINCIDPGGFGAVTITKSISLICDEVENGILVSSGNGIVINNATADVVISGFDLEGLGNNGSAATTNGINVINAASVQVRNTTIHGFMGYGIFVQPQTSSTKLFLDNVQLIDNGTTGNAASGGLGITPASNFSVTASIHNVRVFNNANVGVRLDTSGTTGTAITVKVDSSVIDNNGNGFLVKALPGTGTARLLINDSSVSLNTGFGVQANGSGALARVDDTAITGNGTGVSAANSATISSYGTNQLDGNTADGTFSGTIAPK
ncbi:MAG: hypothetical protein ACAH11_14500 [Sphingomonas sp.]